MICPQCRSEYRQGFTVCADCEVPLVPQYATGAELELPAPPAVPGDPNEDPFCAFWKGDDPRLHAELISVLDAANLPHKTIRRQDHLFNLNNYPVFQIAVPFSHYERAENAVRDAFDLEASESDAVQSLTTIPLLPDDSRPGRWLPSALSPSADEAIPGPPSAGGGSWIPEDATVSVWSGQDSYLREMLVASLNENRIACRLENAGDSSTVFVQPAYETRAREIIREVEESKSPD